MTATAENDNAVIYPVVVVKVEGVKCRALLDTGAGSSYASAALLNQVRVRPHQREVRRIEMLMGVTTRKVELTSVKIANLSGSFHLNVEVTKVDKSELLSLANPKYPELLARHPYLKGVKMDDNDQKNELPVHIILGASEFARIKTEVQPKVGHPGEPVAEKTRFGWTIMSPGKEAELSQMMLTQTSQPEYERLCRLDVLGLADSPEGDQDEVYSEFKEQLKQSPQRWCETGLPWKGNHPVLPNNEGGSIRRLAHLLRKLERSGLMGKYDEVIKDQIAAGIVERVSEPAKGTEFYIPHKAVVRETAKTTKLRIVYGASARAWKKAPSLNECLHAGSPLQNQLWNVLVGGRFHPVAVTGDMKQAFLQVRIKQEERDALRFHWVIDLESKRVETLWFTRALFGLAPSPFLLGGVVQQHLDSCRVEHPEAVAEIQRSLYVDDLITGRIDCTRSSADQKLRNQDLQQGQIPTPQMERKCA